MNFQENLGGQGMNGGINGGAGQGGMVSMGTVSYTHLTLPTKA